jgi:hypothetical protein
VVLIVRADDRALDREVLRRAVEDEIAAPVILDRDGAATGAPRRWLTVGLDTARNELAVSFEESGRETVTRVVPADPDAGTLIRRAAWLAGDLLRDEASDLLPRHAAVEPPPPASLRLDPPVIVTAAPARRPRSSSVTAAIFFPLATNFDAPDVHTRLNLNLLYGRVGALEGLQLGGANQVDGDVSGAQLGFLFNVAGGDVHGMQVASAANLARADVHGFQLGLVANRARGDLEGFQVSAVNTTGGNVDGGQVGVFNGAGGDVRGVQLGLVNVARNVRGMQLGLINVADDVEGIPIGIVSVTKTGGVHPVLWTSSASYVNVGIKFATRYTFTEFSGSATDEAGIRMYGPGLALGFRIPMSRWGFEGDAWAAYLFGGPLYGVSQRDGLRDDMLLTALRARLTFELHRHFSVFVGAALVGKVRFHQVSPTTADQSGETTVGLGPDLNVGVQL